MKTSISEKLFYKIGEVATLTELEPYVLRYWEGEFNFKLTKSKNNQRLYQRKDIDQIQRIKTLLYGEKFTIAGAKKRLREMNKKKGENGQMALALPPSIERKVVERREQLLEIRREVQSILEALEPTN